MEINLNINKHINLEEFKYNKDPWFINLTDSIIPKNVQDLLRLGDNFYNPIFANKKEQNFEVLKEMEKNIDKIPAEHKEELRLKFVNLSKSFLSKQHKLTEIDTFILKLLIEQKPF